MEPERFDELATSVAEGEASRRSVVMRLGGGGLAALLAAIGFGGDGTEEAEARKGRKPRKPRKRRRRRRRGGGNTTVQAGFPITINNSLIGNACALADDCGGTGSGLACVAGFCAIDTTIICTSGADCATGACVAGFCDTCDDLLEVCGDPGNQQCCVVEADCISGACVIQ